MNIFNYSLNEIAELHPFSLFYLLTFSGILFLWVILKMVRILLSWRIRIQEARIKVTEKELEDLKNYQPAKSGSMLGRLRKEAKDSLVTNLNPALTFDKLEAWNFDLSSKGSWVEYSILVGDGVYLVLFFEYGDVTVCLTYLDSEIPLDAKVVYDHQVEDLFTTLTGGKKLGNG